MGPLDGIRVLDFTRVVAGPLATRILADQGAEVIKIEPPEGDMSRTFPPVDGDGLSPYFAQQNSGKRFCSLDLGVDGGPDLARELLATCDVVVENFRPGVMDRFGLGPAAMCERYPTLVYCSITGFGQTGPWANRRAYAPIGHLESGLMEYDRRKIGREPKQPAIVLGDAITATMAAGAISSMLVQAARTGVGGPLDVCMVESMVYIQEWASTELAGGWSHAANAGSCQESPMLHLPDGRIWGLGGNPVAWFEPITVAMDRSDLLTDPRFARPEDRFANREQLIDIITEWAASFGSFEEFLHRVESTSPFTAAELRSIDELAQSDWARERNLFTDTSMGVAVPTRSAGGAGIGTTGRVAARGADNADVLGQLLGLDADAVGGLAARGVLSSA
ncbi:MAG: CoA transferase [Actinomycetota bacterium]